jgi:hypothetical protein
MKLVKGIVGQREEIKGSVDNHQKNEKSFPMANPKL